MNIHRRKFLKQSLGLGAGALTLPALFQVGCSTTGVNARRAQMGLQVYSVRNQLKADFAGTLKQVADIGYKNIEAYGLGKDGSYLRKIKASEYKKICNDLGMNLVATHCGYVEASDAQGYIDGALASGVEYLIVPYLGGEMRKSIDDYKRVAENFNAVGQQAKAAGLKFGYHNHAFEFESMEGQTPMQVLIDETDPAYVRFELDLFWITKGGLDPVVFIDKNTGRFSCFHVKDATTDLKAATVGSGTIDFATIFARNRKYLSYYFVEDERTDTPLQNVRAAHDYLKAAKFV